MAASVKRVAARPSPRSAHGENGGPVWAAAPMHPQGLA